MWSIWLNLINYHQLLISWVIIAQKCAKQPASYQCNVWHDFTRFLPGFYTWVNESYKNLGDKTEGFRRASILWYKPGQYLTELTSWWDFKHSDASSVWCLEYIKIPANVGATFPFKQSNIKKKSVINCMVKQATWNKATQKQKRGFIDNEHFKSWKQKVDQ